MTELNDTASLPIVRMNPKVATVTEAVTTEEAGITKAEGASDNKNKTTSISKKDRLKDELQELHQEMEIAEYAKTHNGQFKRKLPKSMSCARTKKRKLLEASDAKYSAVSMEVVNELRLRGSRVALQDEVIQGSAINPRMIVDRDITAMTLEEDVDESEDETDDNESDDDESDDDIPTKTSASPVKVNNNNTTVPKRRLLYRMRNFKSHRMAQRHGDALGAHARGLPREAIRKLKQVAADAPNAPQVYSSLGMVYEDLMKSHRKGGESEELDEELFEEQLRLAKKAYGSYHVAAVLCKKDFTLWVRAGDTAIGIVSLLNEAMQTFRHMGTEAPRNLFLRSEKLRWLEDAKRDYIVADNLKPPGIDIPAKLADVQIQLCNLSEALTLLTDLKNREAPKQGEGDKFQPRSDFERSYKAWLLYSDLMLRIGHECTQWNRGIRSIDNYMFKRWLRKFATSFDWQERRLQSLTLALEAAAGSEVCSELMAWSRKRAKNYTESFDPKESVRWHGDSSEDQVVERSNIADDTSPEVFENIDNKVERLDGISDMNENVKNEDEECNHNEDENADEREDDLGLTMDEEKCSHLIKPRQQSDFEAQRMKVLAANRAELEEFDENTRELRLNEDSEEQRRREELRNTTMKAHRLAIFSMVGQYLSNKATPDNPSETTSIKQPLFIAASCSTVCAIASELMKHCLGLEEFEGARMVGNVTSSYLKCRVTMHRKRQASIIAFTRRQESTENSVLLNLEAYDGVANDSTDESDDEVEASYLSDEDMIEGEDSVSILKSMEAGYLPTELQVLYAMSLIGEGGSDYAASKAILAITILDDKDTTMSVEAADIDVIQSKPWQIFRRASTEPLQKIPAFAFVADLLKRTGKETEWSATLAGLFHDQVEQMRERGTLGASLEKVTPTDSAQMKLRRQQVLKIVLAAARLNLTNTKTLVLQESLEHAASKALNVLDQLVVILKALWNVEGDGSVPTTCIEVLALASIAMDSIKAWILDDTFNRCNDVRKAADRLSSILSIVLRQNIYVPCDNQKGSDGTEKLLPGWTELPISSDWQTTDERERSISAYNLVVSCCVTSFSGFEVEEFNLNLLKRNAGGTSYFGVSMHDDRVSGPINADVETRIQKLWTNLGRHLKWVAAFDISSCLQSAKDTTWFDIAGPRQDLIARYGESHVLALLLDFSDVCLSLITTSDDGDNGTIRVVLSTILPILQFCLGTKIWDSDIGKSITSLSSSAQMKKKALGFTTIDFSSSDPRQPDELDGELMMKARGDPSMRMRDQWVSELSGRDSLAKIVRLPSSTFLAEWKSEESPLDHITDYEVSSDAMRHVETGLYSLRQCSTHAAVQKISLQVSLALLEIVATGKAYNPFVCLQQAAIYASLSPKGGSHDVPFQTVLPDEKACTALEALVIAGRADCLQALHFPTEAMFLCNFIGRVCLRHRDRLQDGIDWNNQWKVVSIYAYNTAMVIRSTIIALLSSKEAQQKVLHGWEDDVLAELERARLDGIALKKTLAQNDEKVEADDISESSADEDVSYRKVDQSFEQDLVFNMEDDDEEDDDDDVSDSSRDDDDDEDTTGGDLFKKSDQQSTAISFEVVTHRMQKDDDGWSDTDVIAV